MNQSSHQLLLKLLDAWQRNPDREYKVRLPITITRAPQYFAAVLPDQKDDLHAGLQEAAATGAVTLEWGKGFESHILKRLTLEDGPGLADYLGCTLAASQANTARLVFEREVSGHEQWIKDFVQHLLDKWGRNRNAFGLAPGETIQTCHLIRALEAVAAGRQRNMDMRTFSVREFGDSKVFEGMQTKFVAVWKHYHPTDLDTDELLETLGLVKFPHPLLLKGQITLHLTTRDLDCRCIEPFVGLPPQSIRGISTAELPTYVITIENLASFNRYAAELHDHGLVVYTAGFPTPGVADFLQMLDKCLPATVPFFHWGDMDEGGLKICAFVQELLQRPLQPHLMTPDLLEHFGTKKIDLRVKELLETAHRHPIVKSLADAILSSDPPKVLEQEYIDPRVP